ncbi:MAG: galactose-1-phosphate uridylyltransferase [Candidatus Parvarchaeum sp.]
MQNTVREDEIRVDYRTGTKILFSSVRNNKPADFYNLSEDKWESDVSRCPFEYGKESLNKTIELVGGDEHSWKLKIIENKFPMLSPKFDFTPEDGFLREEPAFGYCEVIFETPTHNVRFSQLQKEDYLRWIDAVIEREKALYSRDRIKYVYTFKNEGPRSGASLSHAHSQIMAFEEIPKTIKEEQEKIREFYDKNKECLYEHAIKYEKERLLAENESFIAFAPFGSKMSSESVIMPKRHVNYVGLLSDQEKSDFVDLISKVVKTNEVLFGKLSYNLLFHELKSDSNFHFHVEIYPRVITFAAVEFAGFNTNQLFPEKYAEMFRGALK